MELVRLKAHANKRARLSGSLALRVITTCCAHESRDNTSTGRAEATNDRPALTETDPGEIENGCSQQ